MNLSILAQVFAKCKRNTAILSFSNSLEKVLKLLFGHIWAFYIRGFNLIMRFMSFTICKAAEDL